MSMGCSLAERPNQTRRAAAGVTRYECTQAVNTYSTGLGGGGEVYANAGAGFYSRDPDVVVDQGADWAFSIEPLVADGGGEAVGTSRYLRIDGFALLAGVCFLACGILY
jgi:hypothetical protein